MHKRSLDFPIEHRAAALGFCHNQQRFVVPLRALDSMNYLTPVQWTPVADRKSQTRIDREALLNKPSNADQQRLQLILYLIADYCTET